MRVGGSSVLGCVEKSGVRWNHFELREYDPVIGRWTSTDPYGQHWSSYLGMSNDPINRVDPDGGFDDVYYNSKTNQTTIVKTNDNFDRFFIDGKFQTLQNKGWGLSVFSDATVFGSYSSSAFVSAFGDQLRSDEFFFQQLKYVRSEQANGALFGARVATKDATILYVTLALPVAVITGGELIAAAPAIASGASQLYGAASSGINTLYWQAGAGANYINLAGSKLARDVVFKVAYTTAPILGKTKIGSAVLTEMAWFSHNGSINFLKIGEKLAGTLKGAGEVLD